MWKRSSGTATRWTGRRRSRIGTSIWPRSTSRGGVARPARDLRRHKWESVLLEALNHLIYRRFLSYPFRTVYHRKQIASGLSTRTTPPCARTSCFRVSKKDLVRMDLVPHNDFLDRLVPA